MSLKTQQQRQRKLQKKQHSYYYYIIMQNDFWIYIIIHIQNINAITKKYYML